MIAPTRMTPWIALAPDISGVCSTEETLDTTSKPTKTASTKNVSSVVPSRHAVVLPGRVTQAAGDDLVVEVRHDLPVSVISSSRFTTLRA